MAMTTNPKQPELIVFSDRAYNAIIAETKAHNQTETGGILLGTMLDNGIWIVMESIPPGYASIYQPAYFEYDSQFVNYLANVIANQYQNPLSLLGLWHRHPGSFDQFSATDMDTNFRFAQETKRGILSGIVNIDPQFRLTLYYCEENRKPRPIESETGSELIPEALLKLKYVDNPNTVHIESEKTPIPTIPILKSQSKKRVKNDSTKKEKGNGSVS